MFTASRIILYNVIAFHDTFSNATVNMKNNATNLCVAYQRYHMEKDSLDPLRCPKY